jgi:hypothetical protein
MLVVVVTLKLLVPFLLQEVEGQNCITTWTFRPLKMRSLACLETPETDNPETQLLFPELNPEPQTWGNLKILKPEDIQSSVLTFLWV